MDVKFPKNVASIEVGVLRRGVGRWWRHNTLWVDVIKNADIII